MHFASKSAITVNSYSMTPKNGRLLKPSAEQTVAQTILLLIYHGVQIRYLFPGLDSIFHQKMVKIAVPLHTLLLTPSCLHVTTKYMFPGFVASLR
jgi:hypothetical protein